MKKMGENEGLLQSKPLATAVAAHHGLWGYHGLTMVSTRHQFFCLPGWAPGPCWRVAWPWCPTFCLSSIFFSLPLFFLVYFFLFFLSFFVILASSLAILFSVFIKKNRKMKIQSYKKGLRLSPKKCSFKVKSLTLLLCLVWISECLDRGLLKRFPHKIWL